MNDGFYVDPHFMLPFSHVMHALIKQGCILPAEKEADIKGVVGRYSHCNWVQQSSSGPEWSQWLKGERGWGGGQLLSSCQGSTKVW